MQYFLFILLAIALLLEGTVTSLPLVLVVLILLSVYLRRVDIFLIAFLSGLLLDIFLVRASGLTSIFFLCVLLLAFLYERKYEIKSLFFVLLATAFSSFIYLVIFPSPDIFLQVIISALLAGGLFSVLKLLIQKKIIKEITL